MRPSGRAADEMRPVFLETGVNKHAEGSCLVRFGDTHVLCTATVEERVPSWMRNSGRGWITAEYGMLPRSTGSRTDREAARGKQSGRTQEIQRLIGRSLRAVTDLAALGEIQVRLDCDVIQADGGTRTAAITGAYVALYEGLARAVDLGLVKAMPFIDSVAAVSLRPIRRRSGSRHGLCRGQHRRGRRQFRDHRVRRHGRNPSHRREGAVPGSHLPGPFDQRAQGNRGTGRSAAQRVGPGRRMNGGTMTRRFPNRGWSSQATIPARSGRSPNCWRPTVSKSFPPERSGSPSRSRTARRSSRTPSSRPGRRPKRRDLPALADDSGLAVHALEWPPRRPFRPLGGAGPRFSLRHGEAGNSLART